MSEIKFRRVEFSGPEDPTEKFKGYVEQILSAADLNDVRTSRNRQLVLAHFLNAGLHVLAYHPGAAARAGVVLDAYCNEFGCEATHADALVKVFNVGLGPVAPTDLRDEVATEHWFPAIQAIANRWSEIRAAAYSEFADWQKDPDNFWTRRVRPLIESTPA